MEEGDSQTSTEFSSLKVRTFRIPSHSDGILEVLNKQRNLGEFCDITVLVEHQRFTAHKCVLAANSSYFNALLSTDNDGLYLRQISADSFRTILDYMYTSKVCLAPTKIQDVLSAAKLLQVKGVVSVCCRYLEAQLRALTEQTYQNPATNFKNQAIFSVDPGAMENPNTDYVPPRVLGTRFPATRVSEFSHRYAENSVGGVQSSLISKINVNPLIPQQDVTTRGPYTHLRNIQPGNRLSLNQQQHPTFRSTKHYGQSPTFDRHPKNIKDTGRKLRQSHGEIAKEENTRPLNHVVQLKGNTRPEIWDSHFRKAVQNDVSTSKVPKSADIWDRKRGERNLLLSQPTKECNHNANEFFPVVAPNVATAERKQKQKNNVTKFIPRSAHGYSFSTGMGLGDYCRSSVTPRRFIIGESEAPDGIATITYQL